MNEWQPIETAPKDGQEILAWCEDSGEMFVVIWDKDVWLYASYKNARVCLDDEGGVKIMWRHLPAPPIDTAR